MKRHFGLIPPDKIEMGQVRVWRRKPRVDLVLKERFAYYIPLLDAIKRLLRNTEVRHQVDHPRAFDGKFRSVLDGHYYRTNEAFRGSENPLAIILYYDEIEVTNALSSKIHKIGMFYWTLANIYPENRSSLNAINLLAAVKYQYIEKFGMQKILKVIARDITILQTEGVVVSINGEDKVYKGSLLLVSADTPAAALVGGFKRSVSASKPCRRCLTSDVRWRSFHREADFTVRNMETHLDHVRAVQPEGQFVYVREHWQQFYGVNERSALLDIPHFDITKCLVQDIMHIFTEGVLENATRHFLSWCTAEDQNLFTVSQLNEKIASFDYGHLHKDMPSPIDHSHLTKGLHQSSAQMFCLAHTLPFLIGDKLVSDKEETTDAMLLRLNCHIMLLQVCNVSYAYEFSEEDAAYLGHIIEEFVVKYKGLYPGAIVPKFHFLVHLPQQILDFGPLRQQWCMRFEAAHSWFKGLAKIVHNFKNMPFTFAHRYESKRCMQLHQMPGESSPRYLYKGHTITEGAYINLRDVPEVLLFDRVLAPAVDKALCTVMLSNRVVVHGTTYTSNKSVILLSCNDEEMPVFGAVVKIYAWEERIFFIYHEFETVVYDGRLNAYRVRARPVEQQEYNIIDVKSLIYPHSLSVFHYQRAKFVVLFNHTRTEIDL